MERNMKDFKEAMEQDFEQSMSDFMDFATKQQDEEKNLGELILVKEEEMNRMIKLYEFMLKAEKKLLKDIEKAIPEYDELIEKANEIEIKKFVPNFNLKNLLIKAKDFLKLRENKK